MSRICRLVATAWGACAYWRVLSALVAVGATALGIAAPGDSDFP